MTGLQHFLYHAHVIPEVNLPNPTLSAALRENLQGTLTENSSSPIQQFPDRATAASPDVLTAKVTHKCPHLVVGDPPSTGDNTGIPGSAVAQGHRACLRQGARRNGFTYNRNTQHISECNTPTTDVIPQHPHAA